MCLFFVLFSFPRSVGHISHLVFTLAGRHTYTHALAARSRPTSAEPPLIFHCVSVGLSGRGDVNWWAKTRLHGIQILFKKDPEAYNGQLEKSETIFSASDSIHYYIQGTSLHMYNAAAFAFVIGT